MTLVQDMAEFVAGSRPGDLSGEVHRELQLRVLDSLGCAIGALASDVSGMVREHLEDFGGNPRCTLIGGGATAPDLAAFHNGALVRYLDFNDSYLAPQETCHPSDNVAAVLAAAEYAGVGGGDFPRAIERVEVDTFDVAYNIIGGGEEGTKTDVRTKEQADHSLPYLVAVALLDGEVLPGQYVPERIARDDVQALLRKVVVRPDAEYSRRFPREMPCRVTIRMGDGTEFTGEARDYEGFHDAEARSRAVVEVSCGAGEKGRAACYIDDGR